MKTKETTRGNTSIYSCLTTSIKHNEHFRINISYKQHKKHLFFETQTRTSLFHIKKNRFCMVEQLICVARFIIFQDGLNFIHYLHRLVTHFPVRPVSFYTGTRSLSFFLSRWFCCSGLGRNRIVFIICIL